MVSQSCSDSIPPKAVIDITKRDNKVYDLSGANIRGASFYKADLSGVNFEFVKNEPIQITLICVVVISGANLTAAFSGCDIEELYFITLKFKILV